MNAGIEHAVPRIREVRQLPELDALWTKRYTLSVAYPSTSFVRDAGL